MSEVYKTGDKITEGASRSFASAAKKAEASRQRSIKRAAKAYKRHGNMDAAIRDHDLWPKHADQIKKLAEENENLDENLDENLEEVLDIKQRRQRALALRRNRPKINRARKLAQKRMAPPDKLKIRAQKMARNLVRKRFAGKRGANYVNLSPSEKMSVDRAVAKKTGLIKKLAMRLLPKVKKAERARLKSFMRGKALSNSGQKEGNVREDINDLFELSFPPHAERSRAKRPGDTSPTSKKKKTDKEGLYDYDEKGDKAPGNNNVVMYSRFEEEAANESNVYTSLVKKAEKSGIDLNLLGEVYDRGYNTWTEEQNLSRQQYAFGRVNSFINKGKSYYEEDADLNGNLSEHNKSIKKYMREGIEVVENHNKPYVRPHYEDSKNPNRQTGWVACNAQGKEKHFGAGSKKLALRFAGMKADDKDGVVEESNNTPYVKPHYDASGKQSAWKASNKHGKVKYFGTDFKDSAHKHAGITTSSVKEEKEDDGTDVNSRLKRKSLTKRETPKKTQQKDWWALMNCSKR